MLFLKDYDINMFLKVNDSNTSIDLLSRVTCVHKIV